MPGWDMLGGGGKSSSILMTLTGALPRDVQTRTWGLVLNLLGLCLIELCFHPPLDLTIESNKIREQRRQGKETAGLVQNVSSTVFSGDVKNPTDRFCAMRGKELEMNLDGFGAVQAVHAIQYYSGAKISN